MGIHKDTLDFPKNIVLTGTQNKKQNYLPAEENAPDKRTGHMNLASASHLVPTLSSSQLLQLFLHGRREMSMTSTALSLTLARLGTASGVGIQFYPVINSFL